MYIYYTYIFIYYYYTIFRSINAISGNKGIEVHVLKLYNSTTVIFIYMN